MLEVLHARLKELHNGAEPSPGDPAKTLRVTGAQGGSPVSEASGLTHVTAGGMGTQARHSRAASPRPATPGDLT